MMTDLRKDCPMRHESGNCTVIGGFCTAVNDPICEGLHHAYDSGYRAAALRAQQEQTPCSRCGYGGKHLDAPPCTSCPAEPKGQHPNVPLTLDELREIIEQMESCHYECEAGPLENNVAFIQLKEAAYRHKPEE